MSLLRSLHVPFGHACMSLLRSLHVQNEQLKLVEIQPIEETARHAFHLLNPNISVSKIPQMFSSGFLLFPGQHGLFVPLLL